MNKCLVTKLNGIVNNGSLLKIEKLESKPRNGNLQVREVISYPLVLTKIQKLRLSVMDILQIPITKTLVRLSLFQQVILQI